MKRKSGTGTKEPHIKKKNRANRTRQRAARSAEWLSAVSSQHSMNQARCV